MSGLAVGVVSTVVIITIWPLRLLATGGRGAGAAVVLALNHPTSISAVAAREALVVIAPVTDVVVGIDRTRVATGNRRSCGRGGGGRAFSTTVGNVTRVIATLPSPCYPAATVCYAGTVATVIAVASRTTAAMVTTDWPTVTPRVTTGRFTDYISLVAIGAGGVTTDGRLRLLTVSWTAYVVLSRLAAAIATDGVLFDTLIIFTILVISTVIIILTTVRHLGCRGGGGRGGGMVCLDKIYKSRTMRDYTGTKNPS